MRHKKSAVWKKVIQSSCSSLPKICERSTSPRWDEAFNFLVRDPRDETLTVKVRFINSICISTFYYVAVKQITHPHVSIQLSHSWGQALGSLTLPLREVLVEPGLVLDRWLNLDGALPESQILLRVTLKVLTIYSACKVFLRIQPVLQCTENCTSQRTVTKSVHKQMYRCIAHYHVL